MVKAGIAVDKDGSHPRSDPSAVVVTSLKSSTEKKMETYRRYNKTCVDLT